jgi:hypothetical protein
MVSLAHVRRYYDLHKEGPANVLFCSRKDQEFKSRFDLFLGAKSLHFAINGIVSAFILVWILSTLSSKIWKN